MLCPCLPFFSVFFLCFLGTVTKKNPKHLRNRADPLASKGRQPPGNTVTPPAVGKLFQPAPLCIPPRRGLCPRASDLAGTG